METFVKVLIYMNAITGIKFCILTYLAVMQRSSPCQHIK